MDDNERFKITSNEYADLIVGKTANRDINKDEHIRWRDIYD